MRIPISEELERRALAQAVFAPDWWEQAGLRREDFGNDSRQRIYDAIETLRQRAHSPGEERKVINAPNIRLEVERWWGKLSVPQLFADELDMVLASRGRLTELEIERLRELTTCRMVARALAQLEGAISAGDLGKVREAIDMASDVSAQEEQETSYTAGQLAKMAYDNALKRDSEETWADLGLTHLRAHLGRAWPGCLITIGARPNVGKSWMVMAMGDGAIPFGTAPGYISLEDMPDVVGPRFLALKSRVSARNIHRKLVSPADLPHLRGGYEQMDSADKYPFHVEFAIGGDHLVVGQKIRKLARLGCKIIFIDYLQVARHKGRGADRAYDKRDGVGLMITWWKKIAKKCGVVLVLLSQLRRRVANEKGKRKREPGFDPDRPEMDELKEAGDIEEKSDIVLLMWRKNNRDDTVVHVEVAKGKMGGVGYEFDLQRGEDGVLREVAPRHDSQATFGSLGF